MASPPRPSYSGCFRWQSPVFAASTAVAPSLYWVQAHGTPVVQSTDPAGGFFGRAGAPPICARRSLGEPAYAGPWQNSISEIGPQCSWHDAQLALEAVLGALGRLLLHPPRALGLGRLREGCFSG